MFARMQLPGLQHIPGEKSREARLPWYAAGMSLMDFYSSQLEGLRDQALYRAPEGKEARSAVARAAAEQGVAVLDACSNDYLGLGRAPVSRETLTGHALGARASRLVHGTFPEHEHLEQLAAAWVGLPRALVFSSGYACNVGLVSALGTHSTFMVSDELNHASLIDGCRLARARVEVVPHLDLQALETALAKATEPVRWVVIESYFSMDGDGPDLAALRAICDRHRAGLYVDEAHAVGVFGDHGAGRCQEAGVTPDVLVGTFGKALGAQGAFVATTPTLLTWFWNTARSFKFSTAVSPLLCAAIAERVALVRRADDRRTRLAARVRQLRSALAEVSLPVKDGSFGPIVPVVLGDENLTVQAADFLRQTGILAQPIRAPTVPLGKARLRLTVTADTPPAALARLPQELSRILRELGHTRH